MKTEQITRKTKQNGLMLAISFENQNAYLSKAALYGKKTES